MSALDTLLLLNVLSGNQKQEKHKEPNVLRTIEQFERWLERKEAKKKDKEKGKPQGWSAADKMMLGILMTVMGPFIGLAWVACFNALAEYATRH